MQTEILKFYITEFDANDKDFRNTSKQTLDNHRALIDSMVTFVVDAFDITGIKDKSDFDVACKFLMVRITGSLIVLMTH